MGQFLIYGFRNKRVQPQHCFLKDNFIQSGSSTLQIQNSLQNPDLSSEFLLPQEDFKK